MTLSPDLLGLCTNPKIDPDAAKQFRPIYRIRIGNTVLSNAFSPVFPIFLVHNTALTLCYCLQLLGTVFAEGFKGVSIGILLVKISKPRAFYS